MPLLASFRRHLGPDVPLDRARSRTSAYVYGNILVLAAVAGVSGADILHWHALVLVVATTVTTFLAHVLAHAIGQSLGRTDEEARVHLRGELRDALPILSSGSFPAFMMIVGALTLVPSPWAQIIAAAVMVARLAGMGILVERMTGRPVSFAVLWSGVTLAFASAVIVALKVVFTH